MDMEIISLRHFLRRTSTRETLGLEIFWEKAKIMFQGCTRKCVGWHVYKTGMTRGS